MELDQPSNLYKPSLQIDDEQPPLNFDHNLGEIELMGVDHCDNVQIMDDLQLVGAPADTCVKGADVVAREDGGMVDVEVKFAEAETSLVKGKGKGKAKGKRKRGRQSGGGKAKRRRRNPSSRRRKKDEEDVCFICFDGGSLVLCDRK